MTALHRVLSSTKKIFIIVGILFIVALITPLLFGISNSVKQKFFPSPTPTPSTEFGKLPQIKFPSLTAKKFSYTVDTISGTLPTFPDRINVYAVAKNNLDLLSLQRAKEKVAKIGFGGKDTKLSETEYLWQDTNPPLRQITFNILSKHFDLVSNFFTDETVLGKKPFLLNEQASNMAQSFFNTLAVPFSNIDNTKTKVSYLSILSRSLLPVEKLNLADIERVDFFQKDINGIPIVYNSKDTSTTYVLIGGGKENGQIIEAHYHLLSISNLSGTYPIKTAEQAFNDLSQNKTYIANLSQTESVKIKNVFLAYYAFDSSQEFLLPVFVFEGDNGFYGYVSAVKDEWFTK